MALEFLWKLEEKLWTGNAKFHDAHLAGDAYIVLPEPAEILGRDITLESLTGSDCWHKIGMAERHLVELSDDAAALVYSITAKREEEGRPYNALCTSAYVRNDGQWLLAVHQQTPMA